MRQRGNIQSPFFRLPPIEVQGQALESQNPRLSQRCSESNRVIPSRHALRNYGNCTETLSKFQQNSTKASEIPALSMYKVIWSHMSSESYLFGLHQAYMFTDVFKMFPSEMERLQFQRLHTRR